MTWLIVTQEGGHFRRVDGGGTHLGQIDLAGMAGIGSPEAGGARAAHFPAPTGELPTIPPGSGPGPVRLVTIRFRRTA